jgi:hypothetical protein
MKTEKALSPPCYTAGGSSHHDASITMTSYRQPGTDTVYSSATAAYLQLSPPPYPGSSCEATASEDPHTPMEEDEGEKITSFSKLTD